MRKVDGLFYPQNQKRRSITMTKPKTLEQLRADKERDRDAACTGTAQAGASGEPKEVSGTGRTGRNFDRNGKDHAAQRGRDASGQRRA